MKLVRWSSFCLVVLSAISLNARAALGSVYVVDQAAPGAADTNTGAEENPFKTVQRAADVVKPGDTLWSIASRLEPSGDPRPLVAQLQSELHGATLDPGARLVLP
jgi:Tfp pilus assembly protein FimV